MVKFCVFHLIADVMHMSAWCQTYCFSFWKASYIALKSNQSIKFHQIYKRENNYTAIYLDNAKSKWIFCQLKNSDFLIKCSSNTGHLKHCFKTQLSQTKIVLQTKLSAPLNDKHTEIHYGEDIKHHDLSSESPIPWLNDDLYFCKLNLRRPRQSLVPLILYHLKETILL